MEIINFKLDDKTAEVFIKALDSDISKEVKEDIIKSLLNLFKPKYLISKDDDLNDDDLKNL